MFEAYIYICISVETLVTVLGGQQELGLKLQFGGGGRAAATGIWLGVRWSLGVSISDLLECKQAQLREPSKITSTTLIFSEPTIPN